jgi:hypothetical protein
MGGILAVIPGSGSLSAAVNYDGGEVEYKRALAQVTTWMSSH